MRSLRYETKGSYRVVGFLDDDFRKLGDRICGSPILGPRAALIKVIQEKRVAEVLVAIADPPGDLLQYVQECCASRGVAWKVVTAGVTNAV